MTNENQVKPDETSWADPAAAHRAIDDDVSATDTDLSAADLDHEAARRRELRAEGIERLLAAYGAPMAEKRERIRDDDPPE